MVARLCAQNAARRGLNQRGFTLVELLVVIGIIAMLIALMLPGLLAARSQARAVQCMSNIRQLGFALRAYANDWNGKYPPNTASPPPGLSWVDFDRVQHYLMTQMSGTAAPADPKLPPVSPNTAAVFICPDDPIGGQSYSMNIWASCKVDTSVTSVSSPNVLIQQLWPRNRKPAGLILLSESFSWGFRTLSTIGRYGDQISPGYAATTGKMFGGAGGISPSFGYGPWTLANSCELAYMRHRKVKGPGIGTQPIGRVSICFDDLHVGLYSNQDLVDSAGQTTGVAAWSPLDFVRN